MNGSENHLISSNIHNEEEIAKYLKDIIKERNSKDPYADTNQLFERIAENPSGVSFEIVEKESFEKVEEKKDEIIFQPSSSSDDESEAEDENEEEGSIK